MLRRLLALLLLATVATTAHATVARRSPEAADPTAYEQWMRIFPGGPNSLPYGLGDAETVLQRARTLPMIAPLVPALTARGYVRREGSDIAYTREGYSIVGLGFEKPGVAIEAQQPVIFVITRAFEIPGVGWRPVSQAFAGIIADSAGVPIAVSTPDDSALFVIGSCDTPPPASLKTGLTTVFGTPNGVLRTDEDFVYRYCAYEGSGTWQYANATSPGMQMIYEQAWRTAVVNGTAAMIAATPAFRFGAITGALSLCAAGMGGAVHGWLTVTWANPPDTTRVPHP